jgi:hypothetical protein
MRSMAEGLSTGGNMLLEKPFLHPARLNNWRRFR